MDDQDKVDTAAKNTFVVIVTAVLFIVFKLVEYAM